MPEAAFKPPVDGAEDPEYAANLRRATLASTVGSAVECIQAGTLLAALVFVYLGTIPEELLLSWVWRIPFLAWILLVLVALFIRMRLRESPTFIVVDKQAGFVTVR